MLGVHAREAGLARLFFCLQDFRSGSVIAAVIQNTMESSFNVSQRSPIIVSLFLALVVGCKESTPPQQSEKVSGALTAAQMKADLAQYRDAVLSGWSYLKHKEDQQAVDVVSSFESLSAQITESTSSQQFHLVLRTFAASLLDGHSQVFTYDLDEPFPYSWPIGCVLAREGVVVNSLAYLKDNPGIEIGDLVEQVNGIPISTYLESRMSFTSASTKHAQKVAAVDQIFRHDSRGLELTLTKSNGQSVTVSLECVTGQVSFQPPRTVLRI